MWLKYCPFSSKSTSSLLTFSAFIRLFQRFRLWDGAKRCMLARKTARGWGRGWERRNSFSPSFFCKKSQSSLFVRDNRKWMTFHLEYDNGKIWVVSWHLCTLYGLDLFNWVSRDIFRYLIRMEEMRQSLKIIEQVSVQKKHESTDTPISECDLPS